MDRPHTDPALLCFESIRTRRHIISSYWLVVFLALPLWWKTTSIDRLALPTSRVHAESQQKVYFARSTFISYLTLREVLFPVKVNFEAKDGGDSSNVARAVESWLRMDQAVEHASAINISVTSGHDP